MYKVNVYPSWDEVKSEVSRLDLLDIIDSALNNDIDDAVKEYIEENYEPRKEIDHDAAYDAYLDEKMGL